MYYIGLIIKLFMCDCLSIYTLTLTSNVKSYYVRHAVYLDVTRKHSVTSHLQRRVTPTISTT